jgi:hypothetical protein
MILKKFEYSEKDNQATSWLLNDLGLQKINLPVGKNATGKTRTINAIIDDTLMSPVMCRLKYFLLIV